MFGENRRLRKQVEELEAKLHRIQKREELIASDSTNFAVDMVALQPFSIERKVDDGLPYTSLGYFREGMVEPLEWVLYVDDDGHDQLVEQFKAYIQSKDGR